MRILIVEDDRALGEFLRKGLEREGHVVDWVGDGESALEHSEADCPDLMILDLSLPKIDGMEVLERFCGRRSQTSVLVLTGRNGLDARVRCLDLGADDCLLKPFSFSELTARTRALLRRREHYVDPVLRHGELQLNRMNRRVLRGGLAVDLTQKEFALLEYLFVRKGQCVSRSELLEQVWQMPSAAGTNVVDVYINYLRRKLAAAGTGDEGKESLIETVRGAGYRLASGAPKKPPMPAIRKTAQVLFA